MPNLTKSDVDRIESQLNSLDRQSLTAAVSIFLDRSVPALIQGCRAGSTEAATQDDEPNNYGTAENAEQDQLDAVRMSADAAEEPEDLYSLFYKTPGGQCSVWLIKADHTSTARDNGPTTAGNLHGVRLVDREVLEQGKPVNLTENTCLRNA